MPEQPNSEKLTGAQMRQKIANLAKDGPPEAKGNAEAIIWSIQTMVQQGRVLEAITLMQEISMWDTEDARALQRGEIEVLFDVEIGQVASGDQ